MKNLRFTKMHGLGNDFIFVDAREQCCDTLPALAARLCDRHTGIGADGLVLFTQSALPDTDARMRIFNSDGSEAQMCGNAIRCFAAYAYRAGLRRDVLRIETLSGVREAQCFIKEDTVESVRVCMGAPRFVSDPIAVRVLDKTLICTPLWVGVPHAVVYVDDPTDPDWMRYGRALETHPAFPEGTNIDFIRVEDPAHILMRVWERGCGETLCCGTGASASLAAAYQAGKAGAKAQVALALGALDIQFENGLLYMRGPAAFVFEGEVRI